MAFSTWRAHSSLILAAVAASMVALSCMTPSKWAASVSLKIAAMGASKPAQEKSAAVRLEPGKPIEKELAGGATDSYEIQVKAGQFFHASVNQLGIDVTLTLYDSDGKQIATMDSPNGTFGVEQISTIAESAGVVRLANRLL